jgi:hypothetical protein
MSHKTGKFLEFDPNCGLSANVIADKRSKFRASFFQQLSLYRNEKNDKKIRDLEQLMAKYEMDRLRKEQHYKAIQCSQNADPDEIPLPSGAMVPNAAMTPFAQPPPLPPQFHPTMKSSILKKSTSSAKKIHKYPPGPPCGLPPSLSEDEDEFIHERSRRVRFSEKADMQQPMGYDDDFDDFAPVEIPDTMFVPHPMPSQPMMAGRPLLSSAPPIPPSMVPPPPILPYGAGGMPHCALGTSMYDKF